MCSPHWRWACCYGCSPWLLCRLPGAWCRRLQTRPRPPFPIPCRPATQVQFRELLITQLTPIAWRTRKWSTERRVECANWISSKALWLKRHHGHLRSFELGSDCMRTCMTLETPPPPPGLHQASSRNLPSPSSASTAAQIWFCASLIRRSKRPRILHAVHQVRLQISVF